LKKEFCYGFLVTSTLSCHKLCVVLMKIGSVKFLISVSLVKFDYWEDYSTILPIKLAIKDYVK